MPTISVRRLRWCRHRFRPLSRASMAFRRRFPCGARYIPRYQRKLLVLPPCTPRAKWRRFRGSDCMSRRHAAQGHATRYVRRFIFSTSVPSPAMLSRLKNALSAASTESDGIANTRTLHPGRFPPDTKGIPWYLELGFEIVGRFGKCHAASRTCRRARTPCHIEQ